MAYKTLDNIFEVAKEKGRKRLSVACAHEEETLKAVVRAKRDGYIEPLLVGRKTDILSILETLEENGEDYQIFEGTTDEECAEIAVRLVKEGQADFLMKGFLNTSTLMKAVIDKEKGLRTDRIMSHISIMEIEGYHKLLLLTDVGMNINPNLEQKVDIVENAISVLRNIGYTEPKVGLLAAIERVNPAMPETVDAGEITKRNQAGEIKNAIIEGPISFDIVMNKAVADKKMYKGVVPGEADILVVPNLVTGNILAKSISRFTKTKSVAFMTGATVPIVLTSRGTPAEGKYRSILGCCATL